jgi:hypothetical protein
VFAIFHTSRSEKAILKQLKWNHRFFLLRR